ncbi:hypothetical protein NIBR502774_19075 (plasmid) [Rhizobium sp. NIBRBAC000502774]|nr:hypothetical protein NIBR502774_19075 [Rhizobium sp. NIBRBAC000502774]
MSFYDLATATPSRKAWLAKHIEGMSGMSPELCDKVLTALAVSWGSSRYELFETIPVSRHVDYPLLSHINDVTRAGLGLFELRDDVWRKDVDKNHLTALLILHDLDKPLLYVNHNGGTAAAPVASRLPHGVLGALILSDLGFPESIISNVATHATDAPFHENSKLGYLLHYADMFSIDHALTTCGATPYYLR